MDKSLKYKLRDISTHALREEGDNSAPNVLTCCVISTHALREEGDVPHNCGWRMDAISTHALREEGDLRQAVADITSI